MMIYLLWSKLRIVILFLAATHIDLFEIIAREIIASR
jgi:hypothetical protein